MRHALYVTDRREVLWRKRFRELGAAASAGGAPVTYGLIALCCAVFLISPLSGFNPAHGTADALLAAQAGYFERWG